MSTDSETAVHVSNEDLAAYLDGRLDLEMRSSIDSHLADCARCRRDMLEIRGLLADLPTKQQARTGWRRVNRVPAWLAGAAAAVILASTALLRIAPSERVRPAAERGAAASIHVPVITPPSDSAVDAARVVFVWRSMEPRGTYRLTLMDAAGTRLWSISTRDTSVTLPVEVRVAPGRTYLWYVDALAGDGRSSSSGVRSFSTTP